MFLFGGPRPKQYQSKIVLDLPRSPRLGLSVRREGGDRCDYKKIPRSVAELKDDPYRSLAGELRRIGGFAKDTTPFSEFLWADFLREPIGKASVKNQYKSAIKKAYKLAKSSKANYLPGWCGPVGA